jgi:hypothetical protein
MLPHTAPRRRKGLRARLGAAHASSLADRRSLAEVAASRSRAWARSSADAPGAWQRGLSVVRRCRAPAEKRTRRCSDTDRSAQRQRHTASLARAAALATRLCPSRAIEQGPAARHRGAETSITASPSHLQHPQRAAATPLSLFSLYQLLLSPCTSAAARTTAAPYRPPLAAPPAAHAPPAPARGPLLLAEAELAPPARPPRAAHVAAARIAAARSAAPSGASASACPSA